MEEQAIQAEPQEAAPIEEAPAPITAENVVSRPEPPAAPDSSILSEKINALFQEPEPAPASPDPSSFMEQLQKLQSMQSHPEPKKEPQNDYEKQLTELRESQDQLRNELQQRQEQQEIQEASSDVSRWVSQNDAHYPLINKAGYQEVVFQKIYNTKQQTGRVMDAAQAASDVESELSDLIKSCAPQLGYVMRDGRDAGSDEAQISTTTPGLSIGQPANWDEMSDDEQMAYLISQSERG